MCHARLSFLLSLTALLLTPANGIVLRKDHGGVIEPVSSLDAVNKAAEHAARHRASVVAQKGEDAARARAAAEASLLAVSASVATTAPTTAPTTTAPTTASPTPSPTLPIDCTTLKYCDTCTPYKHCGWDSSAKSCALHADVDATVRVDELTKCVLADRKCKFPNWKPKIKRTCDAYYFTTVWEICEECLDVETDCYDGCMPDFSKVTVSSLPQPSPQPTPHPTEDRKPGNYTEGCELDSLHKCNMRCDDWYEADEDEYDECQACSDRTEGSLGYEPKCWDPCSPKGRPTAAPTPMPMPTPQPTPMGTPSFENTTTCTYVTKESADEYMQLFEDDEDLEDRIESCIDADYSPEEPTCYDPCFPPHLHGTENMKIPTYPPTPAPTGAS